MKYEIKYADIIILLICIVSFVFLWFILFTQAKSPEVSENEVQQTTCINYYEPKDMILHTQEITHLEPTETTAQTSTEKQTQRQTRSNIEDIPKDEYEYANIIWNYLTNDMGLNKYCAAGIMGNIMTECGGQTLNIQPYITNSAGHYGICQWSLKYFPEIRNADLDTQLEFLKSTIKWILNDYGDRYYSGFNYEKFLTIQDEREAAKAFAHAYEGCGSYCAQRRLDHASEALRYFEGEQI